MAIPQAYSRLNLDTTDTLGSCDGDGSEDRDGGGVAGTTNAGSDSTGPKRGCNAPLVFRFPD